VVEPTHLKQSERQNGFIFPILRLKVPPKNIGEITTTEIPKLEPFAASKGE